MFKPSVPCVVTPLDVDRPRDQYGQRKLGLPFPEKCGVIRLETGSEHTSVRTDSSASGANADELVNMSRLLFPKESKVKIGYKITVREFDLEVLSMNKRYTVNGIFDHWQVDLKIWA